MGYVNILVIFWIHIIEQNLAFTAFLSVHQALLLRMTCSDSYCILIVYTGSFLASYDEHVSFVSRGYCILVVYSGSFLVTYDEHVPFCESGLLFMNYSRL